MSDNHLLNEILEQPAALRRIYDAYAAVENGALSRAAELVRQSRGMYLTGMATSEYACYPAACLLSQNGKANSVYDVSELLYYHLPALEPKDCLVLVSQSGNSAEIVHILDELNGRIPVIGVYNNEESALAQRATIRLPILSGPQLACGSKTNLSSIAVLLLLAEKVLGHDLQDAGQKLLDAASSIDRLLDGWEERLAPAADFLQDSEYTAFLGRGPARSAAQFTSVIFREVPKVVAEGMGAALFRHGLREMIRPEHRVCIFAPSGNNHPLLIRLAKELLEMDIPVMLVSDQPGDLQPGKKCFILNVEPQPEIWSPLLQMVPLQLVAYLLAKRGGLEPGRLVISTYVTTIE